MSPIELGGDPMVVQDFELSFHYNNSFTKPYTLVKIDNGEKENESNKPFMHYEIESKSGSGYLRVNLDQ